VLRISRPPEFIVVFLAKDIRSQFFNRNLDSGCAYQSPLDANAFTKERFRSQMFSCNGAAAPTEIFCPTLILPHLIQPLSMFGIIPYSP
jgi:hypothetical protein